MIAICQHPARAADGGGAFAGAGAVGGADVQGDAGYHGIRGPVGAGNAQEAWGDGVGGCSGHGYGLRRGAWWAPRQVNASLLASQSQLPTARRGDSPSAPVAARNGG